MREMMTTGIEASGDQGIKGPDRSFDARHAHECASMPRCPVASMPSLDSEWLETDGLGGFASGTVDGVRTRRYHALLVTAMTPPTGRVVLVNGVDVLVRTSAGEFFLMPQHYAPEIITARMDRQIESFDTTPWPRWRFRLPDGTHIQHEIFLRHGSPVVVCTWKVLESHGPISLKVRPFVSGREYHSLHHENAAIHLGPITNNGVVSFQPYNSLPGVVVKSNGQCLHEAHWYRNFLYSEERARGFDHVEDLASPGVFEFELKSAGEDAIWIAAAQGPAAKSLPHISAEQCLRQLRDAERRRRAAFASRLHFAADQYIVNRGAGKTIIAGYPWFTDWGRDTFIAMRGLCIATGRLDDARQVLLAWAGTISQGMLPNRFPDASAAEPEFNAVDASLWYIIAIHEFLRASERLRFAVSDADRRTLRDAVLEILCGYATGTRYGIKRDESDGLLMAGEPGQQLTWMDARVGDLEITPRIGKPVEVQALWINALWIGSQFSERCHDAFTFARRSVREKFWNDSRSCLYDVIDEDHIRGKVNEQIRPNQVFAVGGLPMPLIEGDRARSIINVVERELLAPLGLRSLSPRDPQYLSRYEGGPAQRDAAYHQGTVWPWLIGPFVEAWLHTRGRSPEAKAEANERFIAPLFGHLDEGGLNHASEIADADSPHRLRGCPFQAWSVGELLRLQHGVLVDHSGVVISTR
jgi:predicted glycogen debranching enzyme